MHPPHILNYTHLRLKPLMKLDDMLMLHLLQHSHLIIDHLLVTPHVLLENDLDRAFALGPVRLAHDAVCAGPKRLEEVVFGPAIIFLSGALAARLGFVLFLVALRLAVQLVHHSCDCSAC